MRAKTPSDRFEAPAHPQTKLEVANRRTSFKSYYTWRSCCDGKLCEGYPEATVYNKML